MHIIKYKQKLNNEGGNNMNNQTNQLNSQSTSELRTLLIKLEDSINYKSHTKNSLQALYTTLTGIQTTTTKLQTNKLLIKEINSILKLRALRNAML